MGEVKDESPIITPTPGQNDDMDIKEVKLQFSDIFEKNDNLLKPQDNSVGEVKAESPIITLIPGQNDEMGIKEVKLQFLN